MESHDKHYLILGLRPGATQKEIHSAFRGMAKLYHPDQDSSTYAEMRYYEARRAYDALRKRADTQPPKPPSSEPAWTRQTTRDNKSGETKRGSTACGTGWYAHESDGNAGFSDPFSMYGTQGKFKKRIPFSFGKIPIILRHSINEVADIGMYVRVLLYTAAIMVMFGWLGYGWLISSVTVLCSLFGSAFFRYYFSCIHTTVKLKMYAYLMGSLLYCAGASFLICMFNPGFSNWHLTALMFCALCLLWTHPIVWVLLLALFSLIVYPVIWLESLRG